LNFRPAQLVYGQVQKGAIKMSALVSISLDATLLKRKKCHSKTLLTSDVYCKSSLSTVPQTTEHVGLPSKYQGFSRFDTVHVTPAAAYIYLLFVKEPASQSERSKINNTFIIRITISYHSVFCVTACFVFVLSSCRGRCPCPDVCRSLFCLCCIFLPCTI
jgi:hypothetical protein